MVTKKLLTIFLTIFLTSILNMGFASASPLEYKLLPESDAGERFGFAVAISGDTAVVGAWGDDDNGSYSGSAYIFVRSVDSWTQQDKLTASDGTAYDYFGESVAISGETVVVGAWGDDDNGSASGSAYVFVRSGDSWTQQDKLTAGDGAAYDYFGISVAISEDTIVIGARGDDDNGSVSGSAYVFVRSGDSWTQQDKLTASDGAADDYFGESVAISGDTIVVGACRDDDNGSASGSAYVFVRGGGSWTQQDKLTSSDGAASDYFGESVAICGNTAVVGAWGDDDNGSVSGSAYVFVRSGGSWTQQDKLTASDGAAGDYFGESVAISGNVVVVGARGDDDNGGASGSAYVFVRGGDGWTQQDKLTPSDGAAGDYFGKSVAVIEGTSVIGAPYTYVEGLDSGSANVYILFNIPPVADIGGPYIIDEGIALTLDASGSYDPDHDIELFEWDLDNDGEYDDGTGMTTTAVFDDDGDYIVRLMVTDSHGASDNDTTSVTVENLPPEVNPGPNQLIDLGNTASLNVTFSDPGFADNHTATVYWGDGTNEPGIVSEDGGSGSVNGTHFYTWPGNYTVQIEVTDDDGGVGSGNFTCDVLPVPELMVEILLNEVNTLELPDGIGNSLSSALDTAMAALGDSNTENDVAAANALGAFLNKSEAQRGKKISEEDADDLIAKVQEIIAELDGGT